MKQVEAITSLFYSEITVTCDRGGNQNMKNDLQLK
jgi:hypothetical protein